VGRRRRQQPEEAEPGFDWKTANDLIDKAMAMDAKLDRVLELLEEDDDDEQSGTDG
jgi:hypothetical protein